MIEQIRDVAALMSEICNGELGDSFAGATAAIAKKTYDALIAEGFKHGDAMELTVALAGSGSLLKTGN